jgi:hypothetical protein
MKRLIEADHACECGAHLSDCGTYWYRLWREWDKSRPTLVFLMLNPSTADHFVDDPPITRCFSRAVANNFGRLEVANLFPLRTTNPDELLSHSDPLGPRNLANGAILDAVDRASIAICAWGSHDAAAARADDVLHLLSITSMCGKFFHLGLNQDGSPKHPLYVPTSTQPQPLVLECKMESLTLSEKEIIEATGYKQAARQLQALARAGIPADRRPDGSVRVWRHHLTGIAEPKPQKTRRRPQLTSDMKAA